MLHIKAPNDYSAHIEKPTVFLSGSIEMGTAEMWQEKAVYEFSEMDVLILNPRRDDWDASWKQEIENEQFRTQVEWELAALEASDLILFYFSPGTKSPITLLEFGMFAKSAPERMVVFCPDGFWRKGNIDIVCTRYGVRQVDSFDALISEGRRFLDTIVDIPVADDAQEGQA